MRVWSLVRRRSRLTSNYALSGGLARVLRTETLVCDWLRWRRSILLLISVALIAVVVRPRRPESSG
ncbi:hypothetical protein BDW71DRAFT_136008 [Aspergillus fruticulosus]